MKKNISLKFITTVLLIELIIMGLFFGILKFNFIKIENQIASNQITINEVQEAIKIANSNLIYVMLASLIVAIIVVVTVLKFFSKMFIYPKNKMIEYTNKTSEDIEIRTILHHMTDGIIAFNIDGKIAIINPAAKKLLDVAPEDYTFEDIFNKFNLNINMEKIIYLENLTMKMYQKLD